MKTCFIVDGFKFIFFISETRHFSWLLLTKVGENQCSNSEISSGIFKILWLFFKHELWKEQFKWNMRTFVRHAAQFRRNFGKVTPKSLREQVQMGKARCIPPLGVPETWLKNSAFCKIVMLFCTVILCFLNWFHCIWHLK